MLKRIQVLAIFILLTTALSLPLLPFGGGFTLTTISTGSSETTILFTSGGENTTTSIEIEESATVESAQFKVQGLAQGGVYPTDVEIDVSDDGDVDWAFDGATYGSLGEQTVYSNSLQSATYTFSGSGSQSSISVRIPKNATVTSTAMDVVAGPSSGTIWDDDFSTNKGWSGYGGSAEWERGPATSGGNDPANDHTTTSDDYIIGNDIGNTYNNNVALSYIYSPYIDCSSYTSVSVSYYRWLGCESDTWDDAYFAVYSGSSWSTRYSNPSSSMQDSSWTYQNFGVSTWADGNSNFRLRYGLSTDSSVTYSGWNIDDVRVYGTGSAVANPALDIGDNSNTDWSWSGTCTGTHPVSDFTSELNTLLQGPVTYTDEYGTQFVDIPMKMSVTNAGSLTMNSLDIEYTFSANVKDKSGGSVTTELNDAVPSTGTGNASIPISVISSSAGQVKLSDFQIVYDARPKVSPIPDLWVFEDTPDPQLLDMTLFITDDNDVLSGFTLEVYLIDRELELR